MATGEESTRNETADIKLNRAPFSLRCGDEAHPHDVLIPPWRNLPHSANCAPSCWRTAHIIRFVPPHHSRRSPFISSSRPRFLSPRFVSSVASASYTERRSHVGNGGVLHVVSVSVISTASLDASKQLERWFVLFGRKLCMAVCGASWASARLSLAGEN